MRTAAHIGVAALLAAAVAVLMCAGAVRPPVPSPPLPIDPKFDYPADVKKLERMVAKQDMTEFRVHAWNIWAGINAWTDKDKKIPLWRTWWPDEATFSKDEPADAQHGPSTFRLQPARQLFDPDLKSGAAPAPAAMTMASVYFNDRAHLHIRTNLLFKGSTLGDLVADFDRKRAPVPHRRIVDFHRESVAIKTMWFLVKHQEPTDIPVWTADIEIPRSDPNLGYPPHNWSQSVHVVPPNTKPDPATRFKVVPLDSFYWIQLTTPELVQSANKSLPAPFNKAELNDYAVLVGMHVATKELPDWLWITFWWHDAPDKGKFAKDRIAAVDGVWRNYLMDLAWDDRLPLDSGKSHSCYNPWLEAPLVGVDGGGVSSNCLRCHSEARWHPTARAVRADLKPKRVPFDNAPMFGKTVRVDYIWSLERVPKPPSPPAR